MTFSHILDIILGVQGGFLLGYFVTLKLTAGKYKVVNHVQRKKARS